MNNSSSSNNENNNNETEETQTMSHDQDNFTNNHDSNDVDDMLASELASPTEPVVAADVAPDTDNRFDIEENSEEGASFDSGDQELGDVTPANEIIDIMTDSVKTEDVDVMLASLPDDAGTVLEAGETLSTDVGEAPEEPLTVKTIAEYVADGTLTAEELAGDVKTEGKMTVKEQTPAWEAYSAAITAHAISLGLEVKDQKGFIKYSNNKTGHKMYVAKQSKGVTRVETTLPILGQDGTHALTKPNGRITCTVDPDLSTIESILLILADENSGKIPSPKRAAPKTPVTGVSQTTPSAS